jgi:hypothetical protein
VPLFQPQLSNKLSIIPLEVPSAKSGDAQNSDRSDLSEDNKENSVKSQGSGSPYNSFYFERSSLSLVTKSPKNSKKLLRISSEVRPNTENSQYKRTIPSCSLSQSPDLDPIHRRAATRLRHGGFLRHAHQLQRLEHFL